MLIFVIFFVTLSVYMLSTICQLLTTVRLGELLEYPLLSYTRVFFEIDIVFVDKINTFSYLLVICASL